MPNLDPLAVKLQIEWLYRECPEMETDEVLRADMLEGHTDLHKFLSTVERARQQRVALVKGTAPIMDDLSQRTRRFKDQEGVLRRLAFRMLQLAGVRSVTLPEATLSIRNGTPRVIITDESAIPDTLCRFTREPDKDAINAAIKNGEHVPGASLSNAEETIAIKTK